MVNMVNHQRNANQNRNMSCHLSESVQFICSTMSDSATMNCSRPGSLSTINTWSLLKLMSIKSVMSSNHLILCHPLLLPSSIFPSNRVFPNESVLWIRWLKFQLQYQSFQGFSGLISFWMDCLDLFAIQGLLRAFSKITVQSISCSVLSFLYTPTLISIHDYRKNHSFD